MLLIERFERRAAFEIERANIATFLDFTRFVLENDSKRKTLRTTDIGPVEVDAASTLIIEKRTASDRMRPPIL